MKSFIIAVLLFGLIVGYIAFNSVLVNKTLDQISNIANQISRGEDTESNIKRMYDIWRTSKDKLSVSIAEEKLERMSELIFSIYYTADDANQGERQRLCELIISLCDDISKHERISAYGIL